MPNAAPIFPLPVSTDRFAIGVFNNLFMFWGDRTREKWNAIFEGKEPEQSPKNLLSLDKHMHCMWKRSFLLQNLSPLQAEKSPYNSTGSSA